MQGTPLCTHHMLRGSDSSVSGHRLSQREMANFAPYRIQTRKDLGLQKLKTKDDI